MKTDILHGISRPPFTNRDLLQCVPTIVKNFATKLFCWNMLKPQIEVSIFFTFALGAVHFLGELSMLVSWTIKKSIWNLS